MIIYVEFNSIWNRISNEIDRNDRKIDEENHQWRRNLYFLSQIIISPPAGFSVTPKRSLRPPPSAPAAEIGRFINACSNWQCWRWKLQYLAPMVSRNVRAEKLRWRFIFIFIFVWLHICEYGTCILYSHFSHPRKKLSVTRTNMKDERWKVMLMDVNKIWRWQRWRKNATFNRSNSGTSNELKFIWCESTIYGCSCREW